MTGVQTCALPISVIVDNACTGKSSLDNNECNNACQETIACNGDRTSYSCGTPGVVYYTSGIAESCVSGEDIYCLCSLPSTNYQTEVLTNQRCI